MLPDYIHHCSLHQVVYSNDDGVSAPCGLHMWSIYSSVLLFQVKDKHALLSSGSPECYCLDTAFLNPACGDCISKPGDRGSLNMIDRLKDQSSINGFAAEADVRACYFLFLLFFFGSDFYIWVLQFVSFSFGMFLRACICLLSLCTLFLFHLIVRNIVSSVLFTVCSQYSGVCMHFLSWFQTS